MNLLLFDNYDSFTYNLYDYFLRLGANCRVVRNDAATVAELAAQNFDAIVLSPGPARPVSAGRLMEVIDYFHARLPMLGVCLGHQALGEYFGARLCGAALPIHGKIRNISHSGGALFAELPNPMPVMRYHSLILEDLPPALEALAWSDTGELMALRHRTLPLYGVQFHPESVGTPQGLGLLSNWLNLVKSMR